MPANFHITITTTDEPPWLHIEIDPRMFRVQQTLHALAHGAHAVRSLVEVNLTPLFEAGDSVTLARPGGGTHASVREALDHLDELIERNPDPTTW